MLATNRQPLMVWQRLYERFKSQVLRQEIGGTYKHRSAFNSWKVLAVLGAFSTALGALSLGVFLALQTQSISYDSNTRRSIFLTQGSHYLYIEIEQLFQNSLPYSKSINYEQLDGKTGDLNLKECAPYDYRDGRPYYPAGLVANTYFQDRIGIKGLEIQESGISWGNERRHIGRTGYSADDIAIPESWTPETNRGSTPLNTTEGSGLPILNERFVNWISLSMFPHFRKLWGVVHVPRSAAYELQVESVFDLSGKRLYITSKSWLGMRNYLLSAGLVLLGAVSLLMSVLLKRIAPDE